LGIPPGETFTEVSSAISSHSVCQSRVLFTYQEEMTAHDDHDAFCHQKPRVLATGVVTS
jgi:hypothetical protein